MTRQPDAVARSTERVEQHALQLMLAGILETKVAAAAKQRHRLGTSTLPEPASAMILAASWTVTPRTSSPDCSSSPACTPARIASRNRLEKPHPTMTRVCSGFRHGCVVVPCGSSVEPLSCRRNGRGHG